MHPDDDRHRLGRTRHGSIQIQLQCHAVPLDVLEVFQDLDLTSSHLRRGHAQQHHD